MICLYSASTLYHYSTNLDLKRKFRVFDHVSIFYLIAGSYAPVCLITLYSESGTKIFTAVLLIAIIGTIFKLFFTGKYEKFSLFLYLTMGWLVVVDFKNIMNSLETSAIILLVISGLFYSFGIIFYRLEKIKYSHAIWHMFVLGGSICHYFLVLSLFFICNSFNSKLFILSLLSNSFFTKLKNLQWSQNNLKRMLFDIKIS